MPELSSREKFLKLYANLPLPERDEVIFVDENKGPISWNVSYIEINNNTDLGNIILKRLTEMNII